MTVVVIGGGVIGLLCALELRRRGAGVVLADQDQPGRACSAGNAGWIVPSLSAPIPAPGMALTSLTWLLRRHSPLYIRPTALPRLSGWLWSFWRHCNKRDHRAGFEAVARLNARTMALYDDLQDAGIEFEMHKQGLLLVFRSATRMRKALEELEPIHDFGYQGPTPVIGRELRDLEPALARDALAGLLVEEERHVRPETLVSGLLTHLRESGVAILPNTEVVGGTQEGRRLTAVMTGAGPIDADACVIAAGAWSGKLAARFGLHIPVQAAKGYSITVDNPAAQLRRPVYLAEAKVGCSPFRRALRLAGTLELSGLNLRLDRRRVAAIVRAAQQYIPHATHGDTRTEWVGMRPTTPDGLPVIGKVPGWDNVYIATGHAMLGVTLAPSTAVGIAELIVSGQRVAELAPFAPERFAGES